MERLRRIEKLIYFRAWYSLLHMRTRKKEYREGMILCYRKLRSLGVIIADLSAEYNTTKYDIIN